MISMLSTLAVFLTLQAPAAVAVPPAAAAPLVERIVVLGASASSGFGTHVKLADALEAQIQAKHEPIQSFADEAFFLDAGSLGERQVERAAAHAPTLVVAADFLFWFGYGEVSGEPERLENLDFGLELLEELDCPLLIGRFPDMSPAVGKMLLPSQMPQKKTLGELNVKLEAWAAKRGRVGFVPMPEFLDKLRSDQPLVVGGMEFQGAASRKLLMQRDELHPTASGLGVLARMCIDAACEPAVGASRSDFRPELGPVLESLRKLDASRAGQLRIDLRPIPKTPEARQESGAEIERLFRAGGFALTSR